jgi:glycosyltransferase involved in cell wall biosynthesis
MLLIDVCIPSLMKKEECLKKNRYLKSIGIPVNDILVSSKKGLSEARNDLMNRAKTEWFLFLDDDIVVNKKWWKKISSCTSNDKIGAVNGFGLSKSFILIFLRHLLLLRGLKYQRGFTSNTLIRKKAVQGIKLTSRGRLEDLELQNKIKAKGYQWKFCFAYCWHTKNPGKIFREALGDFRKIRKEKGLLKAILSI